MAQRVGYWENGVTFTEGPFVMVNAGGWRIEAELEGHKCPVLPDLSVYRLLKRHKMDHGKTSCGPEEEALQAAAVDWLNAQVREGKILKLGRSWVSPEDVTGGCLAALGMTAG